MRLPPVLWRREFRRFFIGQSASMLGDQFAVVAIPLTAILVLDGGPRDLGFLTAAALLPSLLLSLPVGSLLDRRGHRRQAMLTADAVRAVAVATVPAMFAVGHLTLAHLYLVAFVVGVFDVVFFVAYQPLLVTMVRGADYLSANSLLNGSRAATSVVGLSAGGAVVSAVTAPVALVLDALSFAVSGAQLARIHPVEPGGDHTDSLGLGEGFHWLRGNVVVRWTLVSAATVNLFAFVGNAVLLLYASSTLRLSPVIIGLVFGIGALGGVLGAVTCGRLERRLGLGPTSAVAALTLSVALLLYPAARGAPPVAASVLGLGAFVSTLAIIWADITIGAVFAQEIPDRLRARVAGAFRTVNHGVRPVGAVLGGILGSQLGLRTTLWVSAIGAIGGACLRLRPRILAVRLEASPPATPPSTSGA